MCLLRSVQNCSFFFSCFSLLFILFEVISILLILVNLGMCSPLLLALAELEANLVPLE